MDMLVIEGGRPLQGEITVNGAKNAALPILAACILAQGKSVIQGVPRLRDVDTMLAILRELGLRVDRLDNGDLELEVQDESPFTARYELLKTMRAGICVLGPLLGRRGKARVSLPGGCVIGVRPVDLHVKGLTTLGARCEVSHGYIVAEGKLKGARVYLGGSFGSTVTGTANVLMGAALAEGQSVIENAACEPEVQDLADFLVKMGARIQGVGTHRLVVEGVEALHGATHRVIPDRIEAGTFLAAAAITNGDLTVKGAIAEHQDALIDRLTEIGVELTCEDGSIRARASKGLRSTQIATLPYPGFPTDMQAQLLAVLTLSEGISVVTERIYPDRFMHVAELIRMGANIQKEGPTAIVHGVHHLSGAKVMASDLRASAALVLAGLAAKGTTEISRVYHIDRGYERIEERLRRVGARIDRVDDGKTPGVSLETD